MQPNIYTGKRGSLRLEQKTGWKKKFLQRNTLFYHGGAMQPHEVRINGLDAVKYGREFVVYAEDQQPVAGGKLIFSFVVNGDPKAWQKPGAVHAFWGHEGHGYIFEAARGTFIFSSGNAQPASGQEIAFPYLIESSDIRYYCTPETRGMHGGHGYTFQVIPWMAVVAAQINAV